MKRRKLPIGGVQTFSEVMENYDVYVDKTRQIYDIATMYKTVFLARPRRFGKSLLCSTIESLFLGKKDLFKGLYISETDWEWKEYPVIHLDFAARNYTDNGVNVLIDTLNNQMDSVCEKFDINVDRNDFVDGRFALIITKISEKHGQVVVIVDEYDYPLINTINLPDINEKIREVLRGFYGTFKQNDRHLRFVFVTGVTKFSQISMFSGFNQPWDISMDYEFCNICGITQDELEKYFEPEITMYSEEHGGKNIYLEKLRMNYNGYFFSEDKVAVYNTFGVLTHFNNRGKFLPYWSMSGEPSFMRKYLEDNNIDAVDIENAKLNVNDFGDYKDNTITIFPLLYQSGYLTIKGFDNLSGIYTLDYPNVEVRKSLAEFLSKIYSKTNSTLWNSTALKLNKSLLDGNIEGFFELIKRYLHGVDYSLSSKITEYYFEFAFTNIVNMLGLECRNEVHTANGRMDCVIFAGKYVYVLEFKVDKPVEDALWQLENKNYADIYAYKGKEIYEIGIVFSWEKRNIIEWKIRT